MRVRALHILELLDYGNSSQKQGRSEAHPEQERCPGNHLPATLAQAPNNVNELYRQSRPRPFQLDDACCPWRDPSDAPFISKAVTLITDGLAEQPFCAKFCAARVSGVNRQVIDVIPNRIAHHRLDRCSSWYLVPR